MYDDLPCGVCQIAADGVVTTANAEARRLLGLEIGQRLDVEMTKEDGSPFAVPEARDQPMTVAVRRTDADLVWVLFRAAPARGDALVLTCTDVTDQKRREERMRAVLDSAPNAIALSDREGNLIVQSRMPIQVAKETLMGRPVWTGLEPEDQPKAKAALAHVLATGEPSSYEARGKASQKRWLVHVGPWREGGQIVGAAFVAQDVTAQRELEARLAVADRMASLGALAASIAHEINNPLTYLLANLHWLEGRKLAPEASEQLGAALEGAQRIRSVVADLSSFSRIDAGQPVLLDVRELIDAALRMAHGEIRCRARVVKRYAETPPVLASDGRLGQVFLNLVVNAAQAIPEGNIDQNEIVVTTGTDERGRVRVEVSDTGQGIAPQLLEKVFDPFVTTKPPGAGMGLGLFICRNVVTSLGGELVVESTPGKGSTFRLVLDAAPKGVSKAPSCRPPPKTGGAFARLSILVADDEPPILALMERFLEGHEVRCARSGREAIALLHEHRFDRVFCDVTMADLTGVDVYEHLREVRSDLAGRVVFVTAGVLTERARQLLQALPNPVLEKPFTQADVARILALQSDPAHRSHPG